MIGYPKIPLLLYIAEEFAWEYEDECWEDFLASSLFECDYHWSGKEAPFCVLFLTSLYFYFFFGIDITALYLYFTKFIILFWGWIILLADC